MAPIPDEVGLEITGAALWGGAGVEWWGAAWGAGSGEGPPPEPAEGWGEGSGDAARAIDGASATVSRTASNAMPPCLAITRAGATNDVIGLPRPVRPVPGPAGRTTAH